MNNSLISIIIPSFNRAHVISNAIESVLNQSYKIWELLIIDDGSTDDTYDIVKVFTNEPRIIYKYKEHSGVSSTRNLGADLAKGDYLIFLDSDDVFSPDLLENLSNQGYENYDLICWNVLKFIDGKKLLWKPNYLGGLYNNIRATFLSGSICYRKDIFFIAGAYDPNLSFGENYELGIRISHLPGINILYIDKIFLHYDVKTYKRESNSLTNRLSSYIYQYEKHQSLYRKNPRMNSEMNYLIGYVYEKKGCFAKARKHYRTAFKMSYLNFKALLKYLFFQIHHR